MVNIDATLPTTTLDSGTAYVVDLTPLLTPPATRFATSGALPNPMTFKTMGTSATTIQGTTRRVGTHTVTLTGRDEGGDYTDQVETLTLDVVVPDYPNLPAAEALTIPPGEPVALVLQPLRTQERTTQWKVTGDLPPGLELGPFASGVGCTYIHGTPTTEGTWTLDLTGGYEPYGDPSGDVATMVLTVGTPVTIIPVPAAERTDDGYMLPEVEGVIWTVDDVEQVPGSYSVEPVTETTTVTILPTTDEGYAFDTEPEPLVLVFEPAPDPEPEPDPEPGPEPVGPFTPTPAPDEPDEVEEAVWARLMDDDPQAVYVATKLAERIVKHSGQDVADLDPAEVLTARDHAMTVLEYVRGYVRDRGFIGYIPHRSLQAVIVSAWARLFVNPEQITYYSTGDYSERPATLTGWTAAELGVLRRFRRTYR